MPAMQYLRRRACARQVSGNQNLIFWSSRGIRQLYCQVRRTQSGATAAGPSLMRVRVIDAVAYPGRTDSAVGGRVSVKDASATAKLAHELRTPLSAVIAYARC